MKKICLCLFNQETTLYTGLGSKQKNFFQFTKPKLCSDRKSKNYVQFI